MKEDEKQRLIENIAGGLSRVSRDDVIERSIGHFHETVADYGERLAKAVRSLRSQKR